MPKPIQPQLVLDIEMKELYIQAGLMDRVVQVLYIVYYVATVDGGTMCNVLLFIVYVKFP